MNGKREEQEEECSYKQDDMENCVTVVATRMNEGEAARPPTATRRQHRKGSSTAKSGKNTKNRSGTALERRPRVIALSSSGVATMPTRPRR